MKKGIAAVADCVSALFIFQGTGAEQLFCGDIQHIRAAGAPVRAGSICGLQVPGKPERKTRAG